MDSGTRLALKKIDMRSYYSACGVFVVYFDAQCTLYFDELVELVSRAVIFQTWVLYFEKSWEDRCHKCDFYRTILSHECATLSRDNVADSATVELDTATSSHKETRLLHHFSRFTILLHKYSSKMTKSFHI